jgi:hypothetical protein
MKTALYPTKTNPPTFGMILGLRYIEDLYDKIYVCIYDKPKSLTTERMVHMLTKVLTKNTLKYNIIHHKADFENITLIPNDIPEFDEMITDNIKIYTNFLGKGYNNVVMMPRPIGWDDTFHRIAFERSMLYERICNSIKTSTDVDGYIKEHMR